MDYDSSGSLKIIGAALGIILLIYLLFNIVPNLRPMQGVDLMFAEDYVASDETTAYLQSLIPSEWRFFSLLQRPRFALEVQVLAVQSRQCQAGEETFVLSQYNLNLSLQDLVTGVVISEESFVAPLPFCTNAYSLTGAIYGTLPAQAKMETWFLDSLAANPNLPSIDRTNLARSGFVLAAENPELRQLMLDVLPEELLVSFDERPAYLLFATRRNQRIVACSVGGGALQFIAFRQDIYLNIVNLETGESLLGDTINGQSPRCPQNMTFQSSQERQIFGDLPSAASLEHWANTNLPSFSAP